MGRRRIKKRTSSGKPHLYRGAAKAVALAVVGMLLIVVALLALRRAQAPELNEHGLRVSGEGRADASQVLDPALFHRSSSVREAYAIARAIPETLNQVYCWCGCIDQGLHRSALECFESRHGADCTVCVGTAHVAWTMTQQGVSDASEIQREIDRRYDPLRL